MGLRPADDDEGIQKRRWGRGAGGFATGNGGGLISLVLRLGLGLGLTAKSGMTELTRYQESIGQRIEYGKIHPRG